MKVWVLLEGDWDRTWVRGVFTSLTSAEKSEKEYVDGFVPTRYDRFRNETRIEEAEVSE